jgi:cobalt-zinc-cadmium efflux system outer membrane protein
MSSSFVRKGTLYLSLVLVFVVGAYGQEAPPSQAIPAKLTLDTATEILLVANPTLLRTREGIAIARADVVTARALPNPDLEVNSESYPLFESHPGSFVNNQELVVRTSQRIETAGKRGKRTRVAQQDVAVAEANLQDTVRQLKLELRQRYYSVVLAKAESSLAQDILKQFDEIIRLNQARFDQGEVSGLDLARVQTERLRFFSDATAANLQLKTAKTALLELLGTRNLATEFDVSEDLKFQPFQGELQNLVEESVQSRPDLIAERERLERERRQVTLEKANGIPNITPFFGYKRDFGTNAAAMGFSVPLPIFNRNKGGVARASAQEAQQRYQVERSELGARREIQQALQSVETQEERVKALQGGYLDSARKARDIAQASYRLGSLDLVAFLDAERAYRETLRTYYEALFDHQVALFQLSAATGKEL